MIFCAQGCQVEGAVEEKLRGVQCPLLPKTGGLGGCHHGPSLRNQLQGSPDLGERALLPCAGPVFLCLELLDGV